MEINESFLGDSQYIVKVIGDIGTVGSRGFVTKTPIKKGHIVSVVRYNDDGMTSNKYYLSTDNCVTGREIKYAPRDFNNYLDDENALENFMLAHLFENDL